MNDLSHNIEDLSSFLNQKDFIAKTCAQINKDLSGLHEEIDFNVTDNSDILDRLVDQLKIVLQSMSGSSQHNFMQFIYKVDLPEKDFIKALENNDLDHLAYLIVRREAQKVFLRAKFR